MPTTGSPSNQRKIYRWIAKHTPEKGRVLDIGCGEGDLLSLLTKKRKVHGMGIELSEEAVVKAVQRGLTVHHGNVEEGLDHFSDDNFDLVIMSLTIQELGAPLHVLEEAFRVGKRVIVVFPNFAHWRARLQLAILGRTPRILNLSRSWYESPNRHYLTALEWERFCYEKKWRILEQGFLSQGKTIHSFPNWRAEIVMYLLEEREP